MPESDMPRISPVLLGHRVTICPERAQLDEVSWRMRLLALLAPWLTPASMPEAGALAAGVVMPDGETALTLNPWVGQRPYTITEEYPPGHAVPGLPTYAATPTDLLRAVERLTFEAAIARSAYPLIVHAGAVSRDGVALVLPALADAGKTTLTFGLAARGWLPLCDDVCPLDERADGAFVAMGCPRCGHLNLRTEGILRRAGVELDGPVAELSGYYRPARWGIPAPVRAIVVPCHQEDAALRIEALSQAEGAAALFGATFRRERVSRHDEWAASLRLAVQVPAFRLTYGSLDSALEGVDTITQIIGAEHAHAVHALEEASEHGR